MNAATKADMIKTCSAKCDKTPYKQKSRPWFDNSCRIKRSEYLKAKTEYRRCNSTHNLEKLKSQSKLYKKENNRKLHNYHKDLNNFRNIKSSDPKSYWSLLNKYSGEKTQFFSNITKEVFLQHFSNLNENTDPDDIKE